MYNNAENTVVANTQMITTSIVYDQVASCFHRCVRKTEQPRERILFSNMDAQGSRAFACADSVKVKALRATVKAAVKTLTAKHAEDMKQLDAEVRIWRHGTNTLIHFVTGFEEIGIAVYPNGNSDLYYIDANARKQSDNTGWIRIGSPFAQPRKSGNRFQIQQDEQKDRSFCIPMQIHMCCCFDKKVRFDARGHILSQDVRKAA